MSKQKQDFNAITGIVTIAMGIIYLGASYLLPRAPMGNPLDPVFFPAGLGVLLTLFGLMLFFRSDRSQIAASLKSLKEMSDGEKSITRMIAITCICGIIYAVLFERAGFVISTFLFLMGILFMTNGKRIVSNFVISALFSVGIFILFNHGLGITLPKAFGLF